MLRTTVVCAHTIIPVPPGSVVVDLGANTGVFSRALADHGCCVHAVEASPVLCDVIATDPRLSVYHYAIGGVCGARRFALADNHESSRIGDAGIVVPAVDWTTFVERHGISHVDLLKVDIEGAEIELFDAMPDAVFSVIDQITVEFHDFNGAASPRDVARVSARLRRLGYQSVRFSLRSGFDTLFVRPSVRRISLLDRVVLPVARRLFRVISEESDRDG